MAVDGQARDRVGALMAGLGRRVAPIVARHSDEELAVVASFPGSLLDAMVETRHEIAEEC